MSDNETCVELDAAVRQYLERVAPAMPPDIEPVWFGVIPDAADRARLLLSWPRNLPVPPARRQAYMGELLLGGSVFAAAWTSLASVGELKPTAAALIAEHPDLVPQVMQRVAVGPREQPCLAIYTYCGEVALTSIATLNGGHPQWVVSAAANSWIDNPWSPGMLRRIGELSQRLDHGDMPILLPVAVTQRIGG